MAQTGYTPILIYSSSTTTNVPAAGSLTNSTLGSELAINITDGKLFYKDNANAIQVIAWKTTPTTAGGTGLTSYTAGDLLYYATGTTLSKLAIGTAYQHLGVNSGGTAPEWQASANSVLTAQGDLLYASAANTLARLAKNTTATRYLANTGTNNNPAWAQVDLTNGVTGTLPTGNGGTGLTSFTANGVVYASSTSALATGSAITFDGTNFATTGTVSGTKLIPTGGAVTGNGMYLPAANAVAITTNGTQAIYIDSSQNVGINTSAVTSRLTVNNNSSFAGTPGSPIAGGGIHLIAADSASLGLNFDTFANNSQITFRRSNGTVTSPTALLAGSTIGSITGRGYGSTGYSSGNRGLISLVAEENWTDTAQGTYWQFNTVANGTTTSAEKMRINSSGNVLVGITSATANGGVVQVSNGITFPATQSACSDVNTLDDYEEGTFTPTIIGTTSAGTGTYSAQVGKYTKIGNSVIVQIYLSWSAHTGTGNMRVSNLPFTSISGVDSSVTLGYVNNIALTASNVLTAVLNANSTQIPFYQYAVGGGATSAVPIDTSADLELTVTYFTT